MMPVVTPLRIPTEPLTEYEKEQERFAAMEVEFRLRKRRAHRDRWLAEIRMRLSLEGKGRDPLNRAARTTASLG